MAFPSLSQYPSLSAYPSSPGPVPRGFPAPSIPHFAFPFTLSAETGVSTVAQGSYEEILSCVMMIVSCPIGACPELPTFGIPDVTFQDAPPDATAITDAVQQWEPRASEDAVVEAMDQTGADWQVQLTPQVTGTGQ